MEGITVVAAAVICRDSKILIAQRSSPLHLAGLWEFPGGKVEPGEDLKECLAREIAEELGVVITVRSQFLVTEHDYGYKNRGIVRLHSFWCTLDDGEPEPLEHIAIRWIGVQELSGFQFMPADIPIVARLQTLSDV